MLYVINKNPDLIPEETDKDKNFLDIPNEITDDTDTIDSKIKKLIEACENSNKTYCVIDGLTNSIVNTKFDALKELFATIKSPIVQIRVDGEEANEKLADLLAKLDSEVKHLYLHWDNISQINSKELAKIFTKIKYKTFMSFGNPPYSFSGDGRPDALGTGRTDEDLATIISKINTNNLDLSYCNLGRTKHGKLNKALEAVKATSTLNLNGNNLDKIATAELSSALGKVKAKALYLRDNNLGGAQEVENEIEGEIEEDDIDAEVHAMAERVEKLAAIFKAVKSETLDLSDNKLGLLSGDGLIQALANNKATILNLSSNDLNKIESNKLAEAFKALKTVTTLNLSNNSFQVESDEYLKEAFKPLFEHPTITHIILDKATTQRLEKLFVKKIPISEGIILCSLDEKIADLPHSKNKTFNDYITNYEYDVVNNAAKALVIAINFHKPDASLLSGKELFTKIPEMKSLKEELLIKLLDNDLKVPDIIFSELSTSMFMNYLISDLAALETKDHEASLTGFERINNLLYQLVNDEKLQQHSEAAEFLYQTLFKQYHDIRDNNDDFINLLNDDVFTKLHKNYKELHDDIGLDDERDIMKNDIDKREKASRPKI